MQLERHWRRVAGLYCADDGTLAAVWLARDRDADTVHLYDGCVFRREVLAVIAEGISCRGRWIPVAWDKDMKTMAENLRERGVRVLPKPFEGDDAMAEVISRDIWERMRSGRFKVNRRVGEWLDEFRSFQRKDGKVPGDAFPLMAATRAAVGCLDYARAEGKARSDRVNYPRLAVV